MRKRNICRMYSRIAALVFAAVLALTGVVPGAYVWADTEPAPGNEPAATKEVNNKDTGTAAKKADNAETGTAAKEADKAPAEDKTADTASEKTEDKTNEKTGEEKKSDDNGSSEPAAAEQKKDDSEQKSPDAAESVKPESDGTSSSATAEKDVLPEEVTADKAVKAESSEAKAAGGETAENQVIDLRNQKVTGLKYDESTGVFSWDALEGAVDYRVSIHFKRDGGGIGFSMPYDTTATSVNLYEKDAFSDTLEYVGTAEYTFKVFARGQKLSDGSNNHSLDGEYGPFRFTPDMKRLGHHMVKVEVYTYAYSYIPKDNEYYESIRLRSRQHGGEVLLNGKPINVSNEGGSTNYLRYGEQEFKAGDKVTVSVNPVGDYELKTVKINGQTVTGTQTITISDQDINIDVYFRQPLITFENSGITVSADDPDQAAYAILFSDKTRLKRWEEGYTKVKANQVSAASLDDRDADVCKTDRTLSSRNIIRGTFFNLDLFMSLNMGSLEKVSKISTGAKLKIKVPDYLKKSGRTYYLIRVDKDDASIVTSGTGSYLEGDITESGLYMIGFTIPSSSSSSGGSGSGGRTEGDWIYYAADAEPEEEEPEETVEPEAFDVTPIVARVIAETVLTAEVTTATMTHM